MSASPSVSDKIASVREQRREEQRATSKATHALVQYGSGNHVPCEVLGQEKDGRLRVQVVGCEPFDLVAREGGKRVVRSREGEKWQWIPGTVHKRDDCDECRIRRGR